MSVTLGFRITADTEWRPSHGDTVARFVLDVNGKTRGFLKSGPSKARAVQSLKYLKFWWLTGVWCGDPRDKPKTPAWPWETA